MERINTGKRHKYIQAADTLEDILPQIYENCLDDDGVIYKAVLDKYSVIVWALMIANDDYPLLKLIEIQEKIPGIQRRWDSIIREEAVRYMVMNDLENILKVDITDIKEG